MQAQHIKVVLNLLKFRLHEPTLRPACPIGCILGHQAEQHMTPAEAASKPVQHIFGIPQLSRQYQMADQYAPAEKPILIQRKVSGLPEHFADRRVRNLHIARRGGEPGSQSRACILHIRQPDIHLSLQQLQRFQAFVASAVPYHGDAQRRFQCFRHRIRIGCGSYQIQVVYTGVPQPTEQLPQTFPIQWFARDPAADLLVLAKNAAQITAGEEHRSRALCSADAGLLPIVPCGTSHHRQSRCMTKAGFPGASIHPAAAGTKVAALHGRIITDKSAFDNSPAVFYNVSYDRY